MPHSVRLPYDDSTKRMEPQQGLCQNQHQSMPGRKLRVFLCHASGDKLPVRDLYVRLKSDGVDPWLDEEKLIPGQMWEEEIPKAVRDADAVVICISEQSTTKEGKDYGSVYNF